jgi:hypothetical protein
VLLRLMTLPHVLALAAAFALPTYALAEQPTSALAVAVFENGRAQRAIGDVELASLRGRDVADVRYEISVVLWDEQRRTAPPVRNSVSSTRDGASQATMVYSR